MTFLYIHNHSNFMNVINLYNNIEKKSNYSKKISNKSSVANINNITTLTPNETTIVPKNSHLLLGKDYVLNMANPNIKEQLEKKGTIKIGKADSSDIVVSDFYNNVKNSHLLLEKKDKNIIATSLNRNSQTKLIQKSKIQPFYQSTSFLKLAQGNITDCYLLSVLYSLSQTKFGENIIKNMVKIDNEGNYKIKFNNKEEITVKPDELYGKGIKTTVQGDLGIKAIEIAYGKLHNKTSKNNSFFDRSGTVMESLKILTGLDTNIYEINDKTDLLLGNIADYGISNQILTCSTPHNGKYGKNNKYMNFTEKFITGHAYSIKSIDKDNKTIEIVNPHNTKKSEIISWNDFEKIFKYIYIARVKKE